MTIHFRFPRPLQLVFASILLVSVAQLALKFAMLQLPQPLAVLATNLPLLVSEWSQLQMVLLPLCFGMLCYALSMLCWIQALTTVPLSIAYPLLSLSYALVNIGALLIPIFHEQLSVTRVGGIVLIILGATLISSKPALSN